MRYLREPHVVARFGGDEEFVAIGAEVIDHEPSHRLFSRAVGRSVVVGEVEVGDAVVKSVVGDSPTAFVGVNTSEVVPESQRDFRQHHA